MPSIAIVGASADRRKYGNKAVRAFLKGGWTVYPVNPRIDRVEGLSAFASVGDIPGPVDRVSMYVPAAVGLAMLDDIAAKAPKEFFLNPGSESPELAAAAAEKGLSPVLACSIVNIGLRPDQFPDE
ncbi:MAG: CoA-binding protein [Candidatus Hydrogenedens sp.]|nr:CoA-binding protein [Candidatus Hydrogenedentota bacterium]NLF56661.1 CoA-binding protein [Candidatus Hydrogenedens sp.]